MNQHNAIDKILAGPPFRGNRFTFLAALHDACVVQGLSVPKFLSGVHNNQANATSARSRVSHLLRALRGTSNAQIDQTLGLWRDAIDEVLQRADNQEDQEESIVVDDDVEEELLQEESIVVDDDVEEDSRFFSGEESPRYESGSDEPSSSGEDQDDQLSHLHGDAQGEEWPRYESGSDEPSSSGEDQDDQLSHLYEDAQEYQPFDAGDLRNEDIVDDQRANDTAQLNDDVENVEGEVEEEPVDVVHDEGVVNDDVENGVEDVVKHDPWIWPGRYTRFIIFCYVLNVGLWLRFLHHLYLEHPQSGDKFASIWGTKYQCKEQNRCANAEFFCLATRTFTKNDSDVMTNAACFTREADALGWGMFPASGFFAWPMNNDMHAGNAVGREVCITSSYRPQMEKQRVNVAKCYPWSYLEMYAKAAQILKYLFGQQYSSYLGSRLLSQIGSGFENAEHETFGDLPFTVST